MPAPSGKSTGNCDRVSQVGMFSSASSLAKNRHFTNYFADRGDRIPPAHSYLLILTVGESLPLRTLSPERG